MFETRWYWINVSNWQIYALQTEEERGESGFALPLEIRDSSHITVANLHMYRVVSSYQPFPYAIRITSRKTYAFATSIATANSKVSFRQSRLRSNPQY